MPQADGLNIGDAVPADVALKDQNGQIVRLRDFQGRNQVVYFYPADDTPGCTVEGKEFRDLYDEFLALDCVVIGVSTDSVQSHQAFAQKHGFRFFLLSDSEGALSRAFGVLGERVARRVTFVLSRELKIRRQWSGVNPRGHARDVLEFIRTLVESQRMLGG